MNITKDDQDGKSIVHCEGRLDATTSAQLEIFLNELIEDKHNKILIDFSKIEYLSSAGMRLLLSMTKRLKVSSGKLALWGVHDDVMEIIKMAGFEQILSIYSNEKEALDTL